MQLTEKLTINTPSSVQVITPDWVNNKIQLSIKRDDQIHSIISGNKWRKLHYTLEQAVTQKTKHIVSFGGGFSNHLHALGYCCHQLNIQFTAIVRGDYSKNLSPMLQDLLDWKTDVQYVDRVTYKKRTNIEYIQQLQKQYPHALLIPEGGSQQQALQGVANIITELPQIYDYIIAPVASGGTLAGLIKGVSTYSPTTQVLGIGVLKGQGYLEELVASLLPNSQAFNNWHINHDFHFGGYAKSTTELNEFCGDFLKQTHIPIEPVYSGKLIFALKRLIFEEFFPANAKVLILHTGGLQGARS
ncbi:MAG: pyridoxal-phosphate dependent enzyme [Paraglaciecola sp.]|uniref:1-aminocyclopropane-1-carboxylate deaminase/D-cysteine desulfhydrase n=1 Tax=Paraglaciecola sp. TaxID=1920173 RepID=UPI003299CBF7